MTDGRRSKSINFINAGRIITMTFTLNKQNFHVTTLYGLNKPHHRENFFQSLINHITSNQNTIIGGDFNMVTEFRDRTGGKICNTHLLGSISLNELLKSQNLQNTWREIHPNKINYTYRRTLSNIHSKLDRIYSSQNLNCNRYLNFTFPILRSRRLSSQKSSCGSELVVHDIGN